MKRVFLPGDSIRMGCCEQVAALLLRRTEVCRLAMTTPVLAGASVTAPCTAEEEAMSGRSMPVKKLSSVAQAIPAESYADAVYVNEDHQVLAEAAVCASEEYI